jgi:transposase-like protein
MNITQVYKKFPTQEKCIKHLEKIYWGSLPVCPYCKSKKSSSLEKSLRYHCNICNTSYSVTVGTIFHKTHIDLQKWFLAISIIINAFKNINARQLARDIAIDKNTAWYMVLRIRKAMIENRKLLERLVD